MLGLTLKQPWAWAVAHAGKPWENRTWPPPEHVIGERIAIHAGKGWDAEGFDFIVEDLAPDLEAQGFGIPGLGFRVPHKSEHVFGAVVCTARVAGYRRSNGIFIPEDITSEWFHGPVGWKLEDVIALPRPVPAKGALGLWTLPDDVAREVSAQVEEVRRAG